MFPASEPVFGAYWKYRDAVFIPFSLSGVGKLFPPVPGSPTARRSRDHDFLISQFLWGMADEVHVVYTRMKSSILLIPESIKILPLDAAHFKIEEKERNGGQGRGKQFEYLPDPGTVLTRWFPCTLKE